MELNNNLEILVEMVPILSLFKNKYLIKLPDSAYGEWLIFKENKPVFYLNVFDPQLEVIKNKIHSKEITIERIIERINEGTHENYSIGFKYWGFLNYEGRKTETISIQKFPFSFLEYIK